MYVQSTKYYVVLLMVGPERTIQEVWCFCQGSRLKIWYLSRQGESGGRNRAYYIGAQYSLREKRSSFDVRVALVAIDNN